MDTTNRKCIGYSMSTACQIINLLINAKLNVLVILPEYNKEDRKVDFMRCVLKGMGKMSLIDGHDDYTNLAGDKCCIVDENDFKRVGAARDGLIAMVNARCNVVSELFSKYQGQHKLIAVTGYDPEVSIGNLASSWLDENIKYHLNVDENDDEACNELYNKYYNEVCNNFDIIVLLNDTEDFDIKGVYYKEYKEGKFNSFSNFIMFNLFTKQYTISPTATFGSIMDIYYRLPDDKSKKEFMAIVDSELLPWKCKSSNGVFSGKTTKENAMVFDNVQEIYQTYILETPGEGSAINELNGFNNK